MKPLKLVMQAFGPYPGREEIDFEELSQAGIFLIKGPTGSGKTTIFDAMLMALYGKSTGEEDKTKGGRNSLEVWRCNQAKWETETIAEFTFLADGRIYRFQRRLVPKRINLEQVNSVCVLDGEGSYQAILENPKESLVNAKAEEIIGLNSNQFRQVVLLPQGQFERFLTADSAEKEQILSRLFEVSQWGQYAADLYRRADERKKKLDELRNAVEQSLKEENETYGDVESLKEWTDSMREELTALQESHAAYQADDKRKALEAEKELAAEYKKLHVYEERQIKLTANAEHIKNSENRLAKAEKAEKLREPVRDAEKLLKTYSDLQSRCQEIETGIPKLTGAEKEAVLQLEKFILDSPVENLNRQIANLENKRQLYQEIDSIREDAGKAVNAGKQAEAAYERQKAVYETCKTDAAAKLKTHNQAERKAAEYRTRYFAGIYGEIAAEKLVEGSACPVCGSLQHPAPAARLQDNISREAMEKAEKESASAKTQWEKAEQKRIDAENLSKAGESAWTSARHEAQLKTQLYENKAGELVKGIRTLEELEQKIAGCKEEIVIYNDRRAKLEQAKNMAHDALEARKAAFENSSAACGRAKEEYEACRKRLEQLLEEYGYPDIRSAKADQCTLEEQKELQETITTYYANVRTNGEELERQKQLLAKTAEPDTDSIRSRLQELEEEKEQFLTRSTRLQTSVTRLENKYKDLKKKQELYETNIGEAEADLAFAKKVRGDTGIGLQRYVLGIMFNQIITEANVMLTKVHGGRYQLYRTDEKDGTSNKKGLELRVLDNRHPDDKGRPVSSLSGGEKFLVSLALSIGMSAVAQRTGLHIEALFIDEGFGTLDESSIADAMDILECVQRSNGMIGIISHVSLLESTIARHLEVVKTERGSYIRLG